MMYVYMHYTYLILINRVCYLVCKATQQIMSSYQIKMANIIYRVFVHVCITISWSKVIHHD